MELTKKQKQMMIDEGYVHFHKIVPQPLIDRALRAINTSLGHGMDKKDMTTFNAQSFTPELCESPVIWDLLKESPLFGLAESAIGKDKVLCKEQAQIALRFPENEKSYTLEPHIDGLYTPHNKVPKGEVRNFSMLVGVALSETREPFSGNFVLWPKTHKSYAEYFKNHGVDELLHGSEGMPRIDLPEPKHILAKPGDGFFVHYQTGHSWTANLSPHVRYMVYFRLRHKNHHTFRVEAMTDIWRGWEGISKVDDS